MIPGLVISGSTPKTVLIRAVGPGLLTLNAGFSAGEVLADPVAQLVDGSHATVATNDDWGDAANAAIVTQVSHTVGAFDLDAGSKDSVLLVTLAPGLYTVVVSGKNGGTGIAIVECYEVP
jgi:hypothetical protein